MKEIKKAQEGCHLRLPYLSKWGQDSDTKAWVTIKLYATLIS